MAIRISCALAAFVIASALVPATEPEERTVPSLPSPERAAAQQAQGLKQSLGLTDEQVPALEAALVKMILRQREALAAQAKGDLGSPALRDVVREVEAAQTEARDTLRGVLGAEQLAGFDGALREERARVVGEAMTRQIETPLELSVEQRERVLTLFTDHARARASLIAEYSSGAGRPQFGASRALRGRALDLQRELERQLAEVLSPDQLAKYNETVAEAKRSRGATRSASPR